MSEFLQNPHLEGGPFIWKGGETLVFLIHGFTATSVEVRRLGKLLHEDSYSVAGPLLPGHGLNPRDANRYRWQDWASEVEAFFQQAASGCKRYVAGGESTGALLAVWLAARHPEIEGLLLYAPAFRLPLRLQDRLLLRILAPFVPYVKKKNTDPSMGWQGYWVNPLKGTLQLLSLQKELHRLLPAVRQPALIVQGRLDQTIDVRSAQLIYDEIGSDHKELYWLDKSSHCLLLDCELDQAAQLTRRFLSRTLI